MSKLRIVFTVTASVVATALIAAGPASAAPPEGYGYEKVTPAGKGAGTVQYNDTFRTNDAGDRFLLSASGSFNSVPADSIPLYTRYVAERNPSPLGLGQAPWDLRGVDAPFVAEQGNGMVMNTAVSSDDLSYVLVPSTKALAPGAIEGGGNLYVRNTRTREFTLVAATEDPRFAHRFQTNQGNYEAKYVANDGNSAVFTSQLLDLPGLPALGPGNNNTRSYRWTLEGGVEAVSVTPAGSINGSSETGPRESRPKSGGAERIFFRTTVSTSGTDNNNTVYVREFGEDGETKLVAQSNLGGTPSGAPVASQLLATSADTRYAVFQTTVAPATARLSDDAPPNFPGISGATSRVLYRYDAQTEELQYLGYDGGVLAGFTQRLIGMSEDGKTILLRSARAGVAPGAVDNRANILLWREGQPLKTIYVPDAGAVAQSDGRFLREVSPNGRWFVFTDNSASTAAQFGLDNANPSCGLGDLCGQVYRIDLEAADPASTLECASCRSDGEVPRGDAGDPGNPTAGATRMDTHQMRMALNDGTVIFTSPDDLDPKDNNGLADVYAYRDGEQVLLSRAKPGHSSRLLDATPDGESIFFSTTDRIAASDKDTALDVYVIRESPHPEQQADTEQADCSGADCRDQSSDPPPPTAGSVDFTGSGNPSQDRDPKASVQLSKLRPVSGSAARLRVTVPGAGQIAVKGRKVKNANRSVEAEGTYPVRIALNPKAKQRLRQKGRLQVRARVSFRSEGGERATKQVRVTFKRPANA